MIGQKWCFFYCFALFWAVSLTVSFPSYVKKCKLADPVPIVSECIRQNVNRIVPLMTTPIPELTLPSIEPLRVEKMELSLGNGGNFGLNGLFTDIKIHRLSTVQFSEVVYDVSRPFLHVVGQSPKVHAECSYKLNGNIYLLKLQSEGRANFTFINVEVGTHLKDTAIVSKNGKKYMKVVGQEAEYAKFSNGSVYFSNLVKDNPRLTEQLNGVLNENFMEIAKELNSFLLDTLGTLLVPILKPLFDQTPLDELFD